jgi:hypothetical protein
MKYVIVASVAMGMALCSAVLSLLVNWNPRHAEMDQAIELARDMENEFVLRWMRCTSKEAGLDGQWFENNRDKRYECYVKSQTKIYVVGTYEDLGYYQISNLVWH